MKRTVLNEMNWNNSYMGNKCIKVNGNEYIISGRRSSDKLIHLSYHQVFCGSYEILVAPNVTYKDGLKILKHAIKNELYNYYYGFDGMIVKHEDIFF